MPIKNLSGPSSMHSFPAAQAKSRTKHLQRREDGELWEGNTASVAAVPCVQGRSWIASPFCALGALAEGCQQPPHKCPHLHADIPLHQGAQGTSEVLGKTGDKSRAAPGVGRTEANDVIKEQRSIFPQKLTLTHGAGQPGALVDRVVCLHRQDMSCGTPTGTTLNRSAFF